MRRTEFFIAVVGLSLFVGLVSLVAGCSARAERLAAEVAAERMDVGMEARRKENLSWHYSQELFSLAQRADRWGDKKLAAALFAKSSDFDPSWPLPAIEAAERIPSAENDLPKAIKYAKRAIALDPNNPRAHEVYAQLLFDSGNCRGAFDAAKAGLALKGSNVALHFLLARSAICMKEFSTAEDELNYLISQEPENSSYYLMLARVYESERRIKRAEQTYRRIVDKFGKNRVFLSELYGFYVRHGKAEDARKVEEELKKILPKQKRKKMRPLRPSRR